MKKVLTIIVLICSLAVFYPALADSGIRYKYSTETVEYAVKGGKSLKMKILQPQQAKGKRPAIVFFYGGGWFAGSVDQFLHQAEYLAARGMVAVLVDYRTQKSAGATPFQCLEDAKTAMRFVKANARRFAIHPKKIVASGGSAGGHLAAACAYVTKYDDPADDWSISPRPAALALFNPVVDNSSKGYGYERIGEAYRDFSPMHNIRNGNAVPTLFMVGSHDRLIPNQTAVDFKKLTEANGADCELKIYEGCGHGFFNYNEKGTNRYYEKTLEDLAGFLEDLGYLK